MSDQSWDDFPGTALAHSTSRRHTNFLLLPMVIVGGFMGLFAGYGVLTWLGINDVRKPATTASSESTLAGATSSKASSVDASGGAADDQPLRIHRAFIQRQEQNYRDPVPEAETAEHAAPKELATSNLDASTPKAIPIADAKNPAVPDLPPPNKPIGSKPVPEPDFNKPSAIVTLTLEKPVQRVEADAYVADAVVCDVSLSSQLVHKDEQVTGYEIVAKSLGNHEKRTIEFDSHLKGSGAGIEITVIHHYNNVICELRPVFSLQSGTIQPLTKSHGTKLLNELTKSLNAAETARQNLPQLQSTLSRLQSDLRTAQYAKTATGPTPAQIGSGRTQAMIAAGNLSNQINEVNRKINKAQKLVDREDSIKSDLQSLNDVSTYASSIASISTVAVRFHRGATTIPGSVK
jgi:hypothetical protein